MFFYSNYNVFFKQQIKYEIINNTISNKLNKIEFMKLLKKFEILFDF